MVTIDITTMLPYVGSFVLFLFGVLGSIGIYYIRKIGSELVDLRKQSQDNCDKFYEKYEELQRANTEIKLMLEHLRTEHELKVCAK